MMTADPRPQVANGCVVGARCRACGYPTAPATPWCPVCQGPQEEARFGPGGCVWAATVVHLRLPGGRTPPYGLAYVDLDDGPRVLARLDEAAAPRPGTRVAVVEGGGEDGGDGVVVRVERRGDATTARDPEGHDRTVAQGA